MSRQLDQVRGLPQTANRVRCKQLFITNEQQNYRAAELTSSRLSVCAWAINMRSNGSSCPPGINPPRCACSTETASPRNWLLLVSFSLAKSTAKKCRPTRNLITLLRRRRGLRLPAWRAAEEPREEPADAVKQAAGRCGLWRCCGLCCDRLRRKRGRGEIRWCGRLSRLRGSRPAALRWCRSPACAAARAGGVLRF